MIFGGSPAWHAWVEARSSFVHGNFVATVLLCQGLMKQLLAAYLHARLLIEDLPEKIKFSPRSLDATSAISSHLTMSRISVA